MLTTVPFVDASFCLAIARTVRRLNNRKSLLPAGNRTRSQLCASPSQVSVLRTLLDYQNRWSDNPDISLRLAKHNAQQAIEKNPNEPFARLVASWAAIFEKDLDRAKSEIDIALSLNPNFASAYASLGSICSYAGQPLEAIPLLERAMRLDPGSYHPISSLPRHGISACRQVRNSSGSAAAAHSPRARDGFFTCRARFRSRSSR